MNWKVVCSFNFCVQTKVLLKVTTDSHVRCNLYLWNGARWRCCYCMKWYMGYQIAPFAMTLSDWLTSFLQAFLNAIFHTVVQPISTDIVRCVIPLWFLSFLFNAPFGIAGITSVHLFLLHIFPLFATLYLCTSPEIKCWNISGVLAVVVRWDSVPPKRGTAPPPIFGPCSLCLG